MTDTPVRECCDCGAHWPEDVMKQDKDEQWFCQGCYYEPDESKPDPMYLAHCRMEVATADDNHTKRIRND